MADVITDFICEKTLKEIIQPIFGTLKENIINCSDHYIQSFLKSLATAKRQGIQTDIYKVNEYINKVLENALFDSQAKLMTRINEAIVFDPLEILKGNKCFIIY